ncbi:MAG: hypothetical protein KatS3mg044_0861 [Rhodothermaceae bacterium]|nr:MAG: hypothetical protein KatS3mg044_0861 [Rhodothermaceae bacterium]
MRSFLSFSVLMVIGLLMVGCSSNQDVSTGSTEDPSMSLAASSASDAESHAPEHTNYTAAGIVRNITPSRDFVILEHEEIPGFMSAMTMPFALRDTTVLRGIQRGDRVRFTLVVEGNTAYISALERLAE